MCSITLDRLRPYNACVVDEVYKCAAKGRLMDLGITRGARLTWLFDAPCGDPTAYLVRGAVIALRASDAANISVKCEGGSYER